MARVRLRRALMVLAVVVAVPLLLAALATVLLPRERLARALANEVAAATGAEVQPGLASLKLVGGLGLTMTDGRVQGEGASLAARTGWGQDIVAYDLAYEKLEMSIAVWPLLRRQIVVKRIDLQGPLLRLDLVDDQVRVRGLALQVSNLRMPLSPAAAPVAGTAEGVGARIPMELAADLQVRAAVVEQGGTAWSSFAAAGQWRERSLAVGELSARLGEGRLVASGSLDYSEDPWGILTWQAALTDLPSASLLSPYVPDLGTRLTCGLSGELNGRMALRDKTTRLATLTVKGRLAGGSGVLQAADWLRGVAPYLGTRQDLQTIRFTRLDHRFEVQAGRYLIESLEIDGDETDWQASGWVGFGGDLAATLGVRLPAGFTPALGTWSFMAEAMRDADGRVNLGLQFGGRLPAPSVGLDLAALGSRR